MNRLQQIETRLAAIAVECETAGADLDALEAEVNALKAERRNLTAEAVIRGEGTVIRSFGPGGQVFNGPAPTSGAPQDPARRTIDQLNKRGLLPADAANVAERLVVSGEDDSRSLAARWVEATGADAYRRAFFKLVSDPKRGHLLWTDEEKDAYKRAHLVGKELRAMGTGTGAGGELLPLYLDPSILLTSAGSINPLRKIARVVQTTSNTWQGVTSAGITAEWKGEGVQAADAGPTLASASIPVFMGSAFVPYSYEIAQDGLGFESELAEMLTDAADQLQAAAYCTGPGTTAPTGFVTALAAVPGSIVAPTTGETFTAPDVYKLQSALPARFQARAQFCAALPTINKAAQMETTNGARLFPEIANGQLLRRPLNEVSNMRGADQIDATKTEANMILAYGDWSNFVIADRIGTTIELIENLVGANQRPTGQRGMMLWFRSGSDVVVPNAFRLLNVATTA